MHGNTLQDWWNLPDWLNYYLQIQLNTRGVLELVEVLNNSVTETDQASDLRSVCGVHVLQPCRRVTSFLITH